MSLKKYPEMLDTKTNKKKHTHKSFIFPFLYVRQEEGCVKYGFDVFFLYIFCVGGREVGEYPSIKF